MHQENSFITLTFDDESLIKRKTNSLKVRDFQLFMKRLRKKYNKQIRFFHCGEYGEKNGRPHYHALLFGHNFDDRKLFKSKGQTQLFTSDSLSDLWRYGFSTIGNVTFESASYTARYVMKKHKGPLPSPKGEGISDEYCTMSRNPGLGYSWFQKYKSDVYPHDYVVIRGGYKSRPPRYYDSLLSEKELESLKERRKEHAEPTYDVLDDRWYRLKTVEQVKLKNLRELINSL
jgi:hypothetical protein